MTAKGKITVDNGVETVLLLDGRTEYKETGIVRVQLDAEGQYGKDVSLYRAEEQRDGREVIVFTLTAVFDKAHFQGKNRP